jgi:hypothetical protein
MQMNLNLPMKLPKAAYEYGTRASGETHGVVLTKPHVVDLILDLAGYGADADLTKLRLLEPACGEGAFLVAAVRRLLGLAAKQGRPLETLRDCVLAFDIDPEHVASTKEALLAVLAEWGYDRKTHRSVVDAWVREDDFLLADITGQFNVVVGNPPYIRIEQISEALHAEYRRHYRSLFDRADLYVAFIERGLSLLSGDGVLSFICADRWVLNKYGAPLRKLVSDSYTVKAYIDLHKASPFESEVIAYPSIFVLGRGATGEVPVVALSTASPEECKAIPAALNGGRGKGLPPGVALAWYGAWFSGEEPWILSSPQQLATLRALEGRFAPIESSARIGIGVATGNDRIYIVGEGVDIEPDRLVPLVMRDDIEQGQIKDGGHFVINAFDINGSVVDLEKYPRLSAYLATHAADIRKRHVAQKNPRSWFRTIDRVYPELVSKPKLLIPDIAGFNEVAFDEGRYHPHHNLYFVTSDQWDLEVLGGLLSSRVALFFVWSYALKMRGGYLRFQAQYLRRIRLPDTTKLTVKLKNSIKTAFRKRDFVRLDALALQAYELEDLPAFDFVDTRR